MITFDLPPPVSVNKSRRIDWAGHAEARAWAKLADRLIMVQKRGPLPTLKGKFEAFITLAEDSRLDLLNCEKVLMDYCVRIGLVQGDDKRYLRRATFEFGHAPEGVRITIKPYKPPLPFVTGARRRAMLEYVANHPEGVNCRQIMDHVYADDADGGPDTRQIISVMGRNINEQITRQGWRITSTGGPGSLYRLVQINPVDTSPSDSTS